MSSTAGPWPLFGRATSRGARCALAALALVGTIGYCGRVDAQPPPAPTGDMSAEAVAAAKAWAGVRTEIRGLQVTDPAVAIERLTKFYENQGHKSGQVSIEITSRIAQIYLQQLEDRDKALEIFDWGIKTFAWHPECRRLEQERSMLVQRASPGLPPAVAPVSPPFATAPKSASARASGALFAPNVASGLAAAASLPSAVMLKREARQGSLPPAVPSGKHSAAGTPSAVAAPNLVAPVQVSTLSIRVPDPVNRGSNTTTRQTPAFAPVDGRPPVARTKVQTLASSERTLSVTSPTVTAIGPPVDAFLPFALSGRRTVPPMAVLPPAVSDAPALLAHSAFWMQLQAHPDQGEALWEQYHPEARDLLPLLATAGERTPAQAETRAALTDLLVRHGTELVQDITKLPTQVRLALADHYAAQKDERAVPIYRDLLAETERTGTRGGWVVELDKLAAYYKASGDLEAAANVLAEVERYSKVPPLVGGSLLEAARLYRELGQDAKAQASYEKAGGSGDAWMKGVALFDRASVLIGKNRHEEARQLLVTPVTGANADQIQIALYSLLGYSYYRTRDWAKAREYSQAAVDQAKKVGQLLANEGLEDQVSMAKRSLEYLVYWEKAPFRVPSESLPLKLAPAGGDGLKATATFGVQSLDRLELEVTSDDPALTVVTSSPERAADQGHYYQTKILVEVAKQKLAKTAKATLTVSSRKYPDTMIQVPVMITVSQ